MKKWTREEIEEWCHRAETESFFSDAIGGSEIIRQLLQQLDEAEATIASLRADIQAGVQDIFMKMYRATGAVCAYCGDKPVDPETHWETCEKHPARKQLDEAEKRVAGECIAVVDEEPEYPGDMPDEMWEAIRDDRDAMSAALRLTVTLTKDGIKGRIRKKYGIGG